MYVFRWDMGPIDCVRATYVERQARVKVSKRIMLCYKNVVSFIVTLISELVRSVYLSGTELGFYSRDVFSEVHVNFRLFCCLML
jgi:hypothetical protein